jgi:putative Holliday junction resolvase
MRVLAIDLGRRRIGLAISDPSATLARPLATLRVASQPEAIARLSEEIARLAADPDGLHTIVVGVPLRLDGSPTDETAYAETVVGALRQRAGIPVVTADERLTSHEADARLAANERDWRRRKAKLDAAAAALILQEYLDSRR